MYLENHFNVSHETSFSSFRIRLPNRIFFYACENAQIQRQVIIYVKIINEELKGLFFQQLGENVFKNCYQVVSVNVAGTNKNKTRNKF